MMRKLLNILAAGGLLTLTALTVQGQSPAPEGHFHGHRMGAGHFGPPLHVLEEYLHLSASQTAAAQTLHQTLRDTVRPLFEQTRALHGQIREALDSATPDAAAIGRLMISSHWIHQQIRATHENYEKGFRALLNPDQVTRYNSFLELRKASRKQGPPSTEGE